MTQWTRTSLGQTTVTATALLALAAAGAPGRPGPTAAAGPPRLAAPATDDVRVRVGAPEVVMDYSADSCPAGGGLDLPDVQARAFRRPGDDQLVLVSGNAPANYWMSGPDFARLHRDCTAVLVSGDKPDAASFDNQEWITAVYRDGNSLHALVHNEYHDPAAANCRPGVTDPSNPCWYNGITHAVSVDAGRTFRQAPAPDHVVAALPSPWNPASGPRPAGAPPAHGYFTPSNIVRGPGGYFYSLFMTIADPANPTQGTCVMRTRDLDDPASWRAWDGRGFDLAMPSPYDRHGNPARTGRPSCTPVSPRAIGSLHGSLSYSTYLDSYVLVGSGAYAHDGTTTCGAFYSLSDDLVRWSAPRLILPGKLPYPPCNPDGTPDGSIIYPSLIDHASTSPSFETVGRQPHLYYVRWNHDLDRDLLRVPLTFERSGTAYLPRIVRANAPRSAPTATPSPTPVAPGEGVERVVTLLVDDGGSADARLDPASVRGVLDDVAAWYEEVSHGRVRLTFDIRGWFDIAMTAGSSTDRRIYDAAVAAGVDFRAYEHVLVLFHGGTGFGSSHSNHHVEVRTAEGTYELAATVSQVTRVRDSVGTRGVTIHELGHALGLPHTNHLSQHSGEIVAYGTAADVMGSSYNRGHFNAYYKHRLGWLDASDVLTATASGTFALRAQELDAGPRLLVIPVSGAGDPLGRLTLTDYVVETRRAIGSDAGLGFNVLDGVLVYRLAPLATADEESGARFQAISLDASPETPSQNSDDFALMPGRTFSDHARGIHITVLAADAESTTVQVVRGVATGNRPPALAGLRADRLHGDPLAVALEADAEDADGDALSVFWNVEVVADPGGTTGRGKITRYQPGSYGHGRRWTHVFPDATPRTVCAVVSDGRGGQATGCVDTFGAVNTPPAVRTTVAPRGPATVRLEAAIADGQPTWVWWDFGDGTGAPFVSPEHTYDPPGRYTARLTVGDGQHTTSVEVPVDATQGANVPPVADAGPDQVVARGQTVRLDASGSYDPDRYPIAGLRYIWTAPAGILLSDARAARTSFAAPSTAGDYPFTLRVYDGAEYGSDEVVVSVR